jgi:hypothetical protein
MKNMMMKVDIEKSACGHCELLTRRYSNVLAEQLDDRPPFSYEGNYSIREILQMGTLIAASVPVRPK